ncbi:PEP-CTERM sorting domain-containing protein [Methyloversatilis sp.]|uniref:PEP-CTERM sorting domain-containing protein n=1 Tax=Methyloversatilis sp. TaxID=2569862 RepID=UPI00273487B6|nr:PEP-CTERM sorting domain-containing protein [Methyloversatilis sp.]MDP2867242.1 PEP-CTERM sorting domain-containing protein [Methyloversatilis sp.]MDP3457061.1 PEP-CTERM sorting domain-containing protein [Methyloversatilis sp.]MDP3578881.1 PEP-CTERM sorting domain-containing protein [Methyloversatilis sp.]
MKIKTIALSLMLGLGAHAAHAFVALPESGDLRIVGVSNAAADPLFLGFDWTPESAGYTRAARRISSVIYDGTDIGTFYDFVYRSTTDSTLLFASRFELDVGEIEIGDLDYETEINDILRSGYANYDVSVGWYAATDDDLRLQSTAHTSNGVRTRPTNPVDVFDDNVVDFRTDISVEEGNPSTAWYVLKTNATEFTYLIDAVTIRQAPSIDGMSPPLRTATFEGFAPIAAIPEPETYAMLLAGLGLIGLAARRRTKA